MHSTYTRERDVYNCRIHDRGHRSRRKNDVDDGEEEERRKQLLKEKRNARNTLYTKVLVIDRS